MAKIETKKIKLLSEYVGKKHPDATVNQKFKPGDVIEVKDTKHLDTNGVRWEAYVEKEKPKK